MAGSTLPRPLKSLVRSLCVVLAPLFLCVSQRSPPGKPAPRPRRSASCVWPGSHRRGPPVYMLYIYMCAYTLNLSLWGCLSIPFFFIPEVFLASRFFEFVCMCMSVTVFNSLVLLQSLFLSLSVVHVLFLFSLLLLS